MNSNYSDILEVNTYILNHKEKFIKDLGETLKLERIKKNITLEDVAIRTKSSTSYITQIEKGTYGVSLLKFITICNAIEADEKILEKFLYSGKKNEDLFYYELQKEKDFSQNMLKYLIKKK